MSKENYWFWSLKLCAAVFNGMATYTVFHQVFKDADRGQELSIISALLAVILVDLFFICALVMLEDKQKSIQDRASWAVAAILLVIATIGIGFADEGYVSWVPRIGFIMLVGQDVLSWYFEWLSIYKSREAQERRIRDSQVIMRRETLRKAYKEVIHSKEMLEAFKQREREREYENLGFTASTPEPQKQSTPLSEPIEQPNLLDYAEQVEDNIIQLPSGGYGWIDPSSGEVNTATALGKPYTLRGARAALTRNRA